MRATVQSLSRKGIALSLLQPYREIFKACGLRPPWNLQYGRKDKRSPEWLRSAAMWVDLGAVGGSKNSSEDQERAVSTVGIQ